MADSRFVPNPKAVEQLERGFAMQAHLKQRADEVAAEAKRIAPVETGAYRDSIEGVAGLDESGRMVGRALAADWKANFIELGTIHQAAMHILSSAAERLGYRVEVKRER